MKTQTNRYAIFALAAAATLWGLNVPLTKLALGWLGPGWVTVVRFAVAAPILAVVGRRGVREALTMRLLASGAIGFGAVILLQNAGIEHTSVSHAAVVVGAIPVLVALIAAGLGQTATRPLTWAGYGVALVGIAFVAGAGRRRGQPPGRPARVRLRRCCRRLSSPSSRGYSRAGTPPRSPRSSSPVARSSRFRSPC